MKKTVSRPPVDLQETLDAFLEASLSLHDTLIQPLDKITHNKKCWYILPDDILWAIPFGAIARKTEAGPRYLIDDHVTTIVNTLAALPSHKKDRPSIMGRNPGRVVAFGNPEGTLPASEKEVRLAGTIHPEARVFSGNLANERNVRRHAPGSDILIFASHAHRPPSADATYISLSPAEGDDGKLSVNEIRGLDLKGVGLVVLSGCGTGLSHEQGEVFLSLADAFLFAGAANVIATLWDVSDEGAYQFMDRFITLFRENGNYEESLRLAQKACLAPPIFPMQSATSSMTRGAGYVPFGMKTTKKNIALDLSHPYYWAPFIIIKFGLSTRDTIHPEGAT